MSVRVRRNRHGGVAVTLDLVEHHVLRLPVSYFDSAKTGQLISRIMTDAEGIRNLVGTGIVQLVGGLFSAVVAMGVLLMFTANGIFEPIEDRAVVVAIGNNSVAFGPFENDADLYVFHPFRRQAAHFK